MNIQKIRWWWYIKVVHRWRSLGREKMMCPLRAGNIIADNIPYDYWRKQGKDRCCSFCGSWHPAEFLAFCDRIFHTNGRCGTIELNDRHDKIYIQRPGIRNAGDGAIKIKMAHLTADYLGKNGTQPLGVALRISNVIFRKKWSGELAEDSEQTKNWLERWHKNA